MGLYSTYKLFHGTAVYLNPINGKLAATLGAADM